MLVFPPPRVEMRPAPPPPLVPTWRWGVGLDLGASVSCQHAACTTSIDARLWASAYSISCGVGNGRNSRRGSCTIGGCFLCPNTWPSRWRMTLVWTRPRPRIHRPGWVSGSLYTFQHEERFHGSIHTSGKLCGPILGPKMHTHTHTPWSLFQDHTHSIHTHIPHYITSILMYWQKFGISLFVFSLPIYSLAKYLLYVQVLLLVKPSHISFIFTHI